MTGWRLALVLVVIAPGCGAKVAPLSYSHKHDDSNVLQASGHVGLSEIVIGEQVEALCAIGTISDADGAFDAITYVVDPNWRSLEYLPVGHHRTCRLERVASHSHGAAVFADSRLVVVVVPASFDGDAAAGKLQRLEVRRFDGGVPTFVDNAGYACGTAIRVSPEYVQFHMDEAADHVDLDRDYLKTHGVPKELLRPLTPTTRAPSGERDCWSRR